MLTTLLAWLYITFLCWTWGILVFYFVQRATKDKWPLPHFSIICITGLSAITIVAGILSLLIPLGPWWVQFLFILPGLSVFFLKDIPYFFSSLKRQFASLHVTSVILHVSLLVLILVMSTWTIVHPDTLGYHAQIIQWIEKYRAVPGLVHLHARFGLQSFWFVDCALFNFSFVGKHGFTVLNSAFVFWFVIFMVNRIDHNCFKDGKKIYGLLWAGLLALSLWSYTQFRLTVTSASADFVATVFVLAIIYCLLEKETKHLHTSDWLLVTLLSIVAITMKLSVAPLAIFPVIALLLFVTKRKFKALFVLLLIGALSLAGFAGRNIITSGYALFPLTAVDMGNVDWKYSPQLTANVKNYIAAYAKTQDIETRQEVYAANIDRVTEWLPGWWHNRSIADKSITILAFLSFIALLVFIKKLYRSGLIPVLIIAAMLAGIVFWFINAPDPRFGFGFILGIISVVTFLLFRQRNLSFRKNLLVAIILSFSMATIAYTAYRFMNFFEADQIVAPLGIPESDYRAFDCGGMKINTPINEAFGSIPIPCTDLSCENFTPRGSNVEDGFRAR